MVVYSLSIFNQRRMCIFRYEWTPRTCPLQTASVAEESELLDGLVLQLREITLPFASGTPGEQHFLGYRTTKYRLHYYESPTGYRFLLITDPAAPSQVEALHKLYSTAFVDCVLHDPTYAPIDSLPPPDPSAAESAGPATTLPGDGALVARGEWRSAAHPFVQRMAHFARDIQ